jgi:hypothetical protein
LTKRGKRYGPRSLLQTKSQTELDAANQYTRKNDRYQEDQRLWQPDWNNLYDAPFFGTYVSVSAGNRTAGQSGRLAKGQLPVPLEGISVEQHISIKATRVDSHY